MLEIRNSVWIKVSNQFYDKINGKKIDLENMYVVGRNCDQIYRIIITQAWHEIRKI